MSSEVAFSWRKVFAIVDMNEYVLVNNVPVARNVYSHLASWLDKVQANYEEEVVRKATSILSKSLAELAAP